jgi:hypothetical protein
LPLRIRYPRPEAGKTAEYSPFEARKAAARPPEAIFGKNVRLFWSATWHFSCAAGVFLGFLANYRDFLGALARSIAPKATFSPQNKRKKRTNPKIKQIDFNARNRVLQRKQGHLLHQAEKEQRNRNEERKAGITATPGTAATATAGEEDCDHPKSKEGIKKGKEKRQRLAQEGEDEGEDNNDQTEQKIPERRC